MEFFYHVTPLFPGQVPSLLQPILHNAATVVSNDAVSTTPSCYQAWAPLPHTAGEMTGALKFFVWSHGSSGFPRQSPSGVINRQLNRPTLGQRGWARSSLSG